MKKSLSKCWIAVFLLMSLSVHAQEVMEPIRFARGNFIPKADIRYKSPGDIAFSQAFFKGKYFVLIQFSRLPGTREKQQLKNAGILLGRYIPGNAFLAAMTTTISNTTQADFRISSVNAVPPFFKIDTSLLGGKVSVDKKTAGYISVGYYAGINRQFVVQELLALGARVVSTKFDADGLVFIEPSQTNIDQIAALPFVSDLSLQTLRDKALNYNSSATHGISGLHAPNGKNLLGRGVVIGIGDNADISTHTDFTGRLINRSPWIPVDHGTHVAGTAAGAGIINIKYQGMAPRATIVNQHFSDIIVNTPTYITDYNMVLTNNSYYSVEDGCPGNGKYDVLSNYVDRQMTDHPDVLHVAAAGNDGENNCFVYPAAFATVKSGWQSAKNVLTVGAIQTENYEIAYFSSRGPLRDGRLKPEITAGGWFITSTNTNDSYGVNYGTSMASPVITGAMGLMVERYRQKNGGADPAGSLLKTIACNTADDLGNPGPDYTYGFGMINARRAVEAIDSNHYFINAVSNAGNQLHSINVPANTRRLKVMLYWPDTEAAVNAASALVNDLDLTITQPGGLGHRPLILNSSPALVNTAAVEGIDRVNNIEQVVINNPVSGAYTIRVNGYRVPAGTKEYVICYEMDRPSVTVEYPSGGEKLVPGELENIRWSAYGNETNNFTVEYSINNGGTWTVIANNVAASARTTTWIVPAAVTNTALIRVSRNGTVLTGRGNPFTVMSSAMPSAENVCEGAVQIKWNRIVSATAYDILQQAGDSMRVIATIADTSYLLRGLDKNKKYWLGVAPKNGQVTARRSLSVGIVPASGSCTLATFNNDLKVDTILAPNSARMGFANASNATALVRIRISNTATVAVNGPFNISYSYAGNTVTETVNTTIAAKSSYLHTFTNLYTIGSAGHQYDFKSWVRFAADGNPLNDTAYKTVKYINNDPVISMPVFEGFEAMPIKNFIKPEMAIGGNRRIDFSSSSSKGRARSFVNTGFAYSGNRAITMDQTPYSDTTTTDSLTLSYNLSNFTNRQLRFDFYYKNHGQANAAGNKVWMRGSENGQWVIAYDLFANQAELGDWKHAHININEVLGTAVPAQVVTATFQLKFGQEGNNSANSANPLIDLDDGYTFDNLTLDQVTNDIALLNLNAPGIGDCSLGASTPINIQIKNYNNATLNNIQVSYQVNSGEVVTESISSIAPNQTINFEFAKKANLTAYIDYSINAWVKYPTDSYATNDSILNTLIHNSPIISSYPYLQGFEVNDGFFYTRGTNSSWAWGAPSKTIINKAPNGQNAWVTGLTESYKNNETSYLYSPCFNIGGLLQPMLSFSHIFQLEKDYDYSWIEYSNNGTDWYKLGQSTQGTNWYNVPENNSWNLSNPRWHVASVALPTASSNIRFRFVVSSDGGVTEAGVGIDDFHIYDKVSIYEGVPVTNIINNVSGVNWIHFVNDGKRIVSVNAKGVNLGATTAAVYPNTGPVRFSNLTYYANRNIVLGSAFSPVSSITARLYFTGTEAQQLVEAGNCPNCAKPIDPYELGITKYSGSAAEANGTIADNLSGYFEFIAPDSVLIIPYDNGYYAEFNVSNLGEFWLSIDNIQLPINGICPDGSIVLNATVTGTSYQWQEDAGNGFVALQDVGSLMGSNTPTLVFSEIPEFYSGYRYRCVVDGVAGNATAVRFVNIWKGTIDTNWALAENWSCGSVPGENTEVVVPGGMTNYPRIAANAAVKKITAHPRSSVTLLPGVKLSVNGRQ